MECTPLSHTHIYYALNLMALVCSRDGDIFHFIDVGNNNHLLTLAKSNHPPYGRDFPGKRITGRFSNGLVATDYVASMLGLGSATVGYLNPEAKGDNIVRGVSFASAASGFYRGTAKIYNVLSLEDQLKLYIQYREDLARVVGVANASTILSDALYLISTGSNDYLNNYNYNIFLQIEYNRRQYRNHLLNLLANFLEELRFLGVRRVGVLSLPPFGCLPSQITLYGLGKETCVKNLNKEAQIFNSKMLKLLQKLNGTDGMRLAYVDIFSQLKDAARFPAKYGFVEGRRGCCGTGLVEASIFCNKFSIGTCANASKYVFWDSFHPSDRMSFLLAKTQLPKVLHDLL
ncbi:GDSL esterase/lipase At5g03810 isoform X2 [Cryptomeria japonica]|uniref:GDSL esterase/lipase At5g03810 isoform X2 n=1 Tax=Cryptomeria japonica TaxID=3369 RepID=UPI0027DA561A|nr:GDSL esterase/lipase At5g03810 isoform X2 [Cryptomeria japonica]